MRFSSLLAPVLGFAFVLGSSVLVGQSAVGTALAVEAPAPQSPAFSGCATGTENVAAQNADFEYEVHLRVNNYRIANSLLPLKWHPDLNRAARYHAKDMVDDNYFEHHTYDCGVANLFGGSNPPCDSTCTTFERLSAFYNWSGAAENIALNQSTPAAVMTAWQNSAGHNANMLSATRRELGVGYQQNASNIHFWVQNFGSRSGQYPVIINLDSLTTASAFVTLHIHRESATWDEISLSNDSMNWTPFAAFPASGAMAWELATGPAGTRKVYMEQRRSTSPATVRRYTDDINLTTPHTPTATPDAHPRLALTAYPNPTTGTVALAGLPHGANGLAYSVLDATGRVLQTAPLPPSATLDLAHLPAGVYHLRVTAPGFAVYSTRVVRQ